MSHLVAAATVVLFASGRRSVDADVAVRITPDKRQVLIGEPVVLLVEADLPPDAVAAIPVLAADIAPFELTGSESLPSRRRAGRLLQAWRIGLRSFDAGTHPVPRLSVSARVGGSEQVGTAAEGLGLLVTEPDVGEGAPLRGMRGPPAVFPRLEALFCVLLLGALAGALASRRRLGSTSSVSASSMPRDTALAALRRLADAVDVGEPRETMAGLSAALRVWVWQSHGVPAPFQSSRETELALASDDCAPALAVLLAAADAAKFADRRFDRAACKESLRSACRLVGTGCARAAHVA